MPINGSSNLVGKSANYEGDYAGIATVGAFCGIYRSTAPITKYLVQTPAYKKSVELIKQGGNGALANLYGRDILGLKFYFPTLEEQNEIVECLEAEDRMITAQEQKVESLKTHKKGLMQQLFPQPGATTPALRFHGFEEFWEEKNWAIFVIVSWSVFHSKDKTLPIIPLGILFFVHIASEKVLFVTAKITTSIIQETRNHWKGTKSVQEILLSRWMVRWGGISLLSQKTKMAIY